MSEDIPKDLPTPTGLLTTSTGHGSLASKRKPVGRRTDAYPFLPEPEMLPEEAPEPLTAGWWQDPNGSGFPLQRYHDGTHWTKYVCRFRGRQWSDIEERPLEGSS